MVGGGENAVPSKEKFKRQVDMKKHSQNKENVRTKNKKD